MEKALITQLLDAARPHGSAVFEAASPTEAQRLRRNIYSLRQNAKNDLDSNLRLRIDGCFLHLEWRRLPGTLVDANGNPIWTYSAPKTRADSLAEELASLATVEIESDDNDD